jgi:Anti-sigma factor NepR
MSELDKCGIATIGLGRQSMTDDTSKVNPVASARMTSKSPGGDPISLALKRIHDNVVEEPMPDSFLDLVAQIEAKIAGRAQ